MRRSTAVLDAPSHLGLRPPAPGAVPGVYKLDGALRDTGLLAGIGANDAGVVTPPRYPPDWEPGRGDHRLVDLEGRRPYVRPGDIAAVGMRPDDPCREELDQTGILAVTPGELGAGGAEAVARRVLTRLAGGDATGFWIHLDVDVLDRDVMPAVDSPDPGGLDYAGLETLLAALVGSERAVGLDIANDDPDLDPTGEHARALTHCLVGALRAGLG